MSMHEIEDLVEDTVRLVLASERPAQEKRRLISNLYRFQAWFDTGETTGRLQEALQALGYFEQESYDTIPVFSLAATIMRDASERGDRQLVHHWLAAVTQALADLDIGDERPQTFEDMLAAGDAAVIRQAARDHRVLRYSGRDAYMRLTPWRYHKDTLPELDAAGIERKYQIRYLADLDTDEEKIRADCEKARRTLADIENGPLSRIPDLVGEMAGHAFLATERQRHYRHFVFAVGAPPADPEGASFYLIITHDPSMSFIRAQLAVQHGLLCRWQERGFGPRLEDMHFYANIAGYFPEQAFLQDRDLDSMGGWQYKIGQSEGLLKKRLASLFRHWPHAEPFFDFHRKPLRALLQGNDLDVLEKQRRELRMAGGFFVNDIELMFAYACLDWERGRKPSALLDRIRGRLDAVSDAYHLKKYWVEGVGKLATQPWFPPLDDTFAYQAQHPEDPSRSG